MHPGSTQDLSVISRSTPAAARSMVTKLFLSFLASISMLYFGLAVYFGTHPRPAEASAQEDSLLEQCRTLCLKYGLIPTGNVAKDAQAYVTAVRTEQKLTDSQSPAGWSAVATDSHPLLGKTAPGFVLPNERGERVSLADLNQKGPVVVVFYYGYGCSHCVAQLFAINEELAGFAAAGAKIVAISSDSSRHTAEKFREYGEFDFAVLADTDNAVAMAYDCYRPKAGSRDEDMKHGTFVVDRSGVIRWANTGYAPFLDNRTLLQVLSTFRGADSADRPVAPPRVL